MGGVPSCTVAYDRRLEGTELVAVAAREVLADRGAAATALAAARVVGRTIMGACCVWYVVEGGVGQVPERL